MHYVHLDINLAWLEALICHFPLHPVMIKKWKVFSGHCLWNASYHMSKHGMLSTMFIFHQSMSRCYGIELQHVILTQCCSARLSAAITQCHRKTFIYTKHHRWYIQRIPGRCMFICQIKSVFLPAVTNSVDKQISIIDVYISN